MGYQRTFDEEPTRVSELACVNDGFFLSSYQLALTTTVLSVEAIPPCIYRAFVEGMDSSLTVALTVSAEPEDVFLPTPNTWGPDTPPEPSEEAVAIFPGSVVARVRVTAGAQTLNIRLISGTGTLYLVPVLQGL